MGTVTRLIDHAFPLIDKSISDNRDIVDDAKIIAMLQSKTFVGLLPPPHSFDVMQFNPNKYTSVWITAYLWGVIFLRNQNLPLFDGRCVELFQVTTERVANPYDDDDEDGSDIDDDDDEYEYE